LEAEAAMSILMYGFWRSIASFRVRVALHLKGLPFEETSLDILTGHQFTADYDALNAAHAVPTLIVDGHTLFESFAILEYLEETHPTPPLLPTDAKERAYARALSLLTVADCHPLFVPRVRKYLAETFAADHAAVQAWGANWVAIGLQTYETLLARRPAAPFTLGSAPGLADICIAGHVVSTRLFAVDMAPFPKVAALAEACFALPAFAKAREAAMEPGH
jgi:maleylpyruvate isomerase